MANGGFRSRSAPDPIRDELRAVRRALLRLHKALIDSERRAYERRHGPLTSGQLLQALIQDPFFAWLRPFSGLLVRIDEVMAGEESLTEHGARELMREVRVLVETEGTEETELDRYAEVRQLDPDVLVAHVELSRRLADALG